MSLSLNHPHGKLLSFPAPEEQSDEEGTTIKGRTVPDEYSGACIWDLAGLRSRY